MQKFPDTRKGIVAFSQRNSLFVAHIQKRIKSMSLKAGINIFLNEGQYEYSDWISGRDMEVEDPAKLKSMEKKILMDKIPLADWCYWLPVLWQH